jgi:hypothetical protein
VAATVARKDKHMPAEVREIIEKIRSGDRGIEDIIALMTLMQGNLDPTSFITGMIFGSKTGGRGLDRMAIMALTMNTANPSATQGGVPTTNPMQQLLPLLLLLDRDDWGSGDKTVEILEKRK